MRHLKAGRKLGRNATHRIALMRNLTRALIEHERIITTVEKAKEARRFVEKLITQAKKGTLHSRRLVLAKLPDRDAVTKLFNEIAPRFKDRPGGYTRVIKRHERRLGDAGHTAFLELLKEGEEKVRAREPKAPTAAARRRSGSRSRSLDRPRTPSRRAGTPPSTRPRSARPGSRPAQPRTDYRVPPLPCSSIARGDGIGGPLPHPPNGDTRSPPVPYTRGKHGRKGSDCRRGSRYPCPCR